MTIPLYHGSRSFYRESIFELGLGQPPTAEVDVPGYLAACFELLSEKFGFDWADEMQRFPQEVLSVGDMYFMQQAALNSHETKFNFRYGSLYLTSSLDRARSYASELPESVRFGYTMTDVLRSHDIDLPHHPFTENFVPLRSLLEQSMPMVLRVESYDQQRLFDEFGDKPLEPVEGVQESFEYRGSISPASLAEV